jgi:hypothetical protein
LYANGITNGVGGATFTNIVGGSGWNGAVILSNGTVALGVPTKLTTLSSTASVPRAIAYPDAAGNVPVLPTVTTTETGSGAVVKAVSPGFVLPQLEMERAFIR